MEALEEFKKVQENQVYTFSTIKGWLLKYVGQYQELNLNWNCPNKSCESGKGGTCITIYRSDECVFFSLFNSLLAFSKYHSRENYAKEEIKSYHKIKNDKGLLKKWVRKNEYIGTVECFELLLSHFDYDLNPVHLLITGKSLLGYEVFVDREDFKNLIKFLEIFNDLFWVKKVYPESKNL